jgi:hypothetical protein
MRTYVIREAFHPGRAYPKIIPSDSKQYEVGSRQEKSLSTAYPSI